MDSTKLLRTLLIFVIAALAISGAVDNVSRDYAEQSLKRALTTFAIARTLNGVISVAQGTEVAFEPGGVGLVMTPGQLLDPVNDLVERFSGVLLIAASSLGLQTVLLEISSWPGITILLAVVLLIWLAAIWSDKVGNNRYVALTVRLTLLLTFVRFAVPVVIICTNVLFGSFLLDKHDLAAGELQKTSTRVEELSLLNEAPPGLQESGAAAQNPPSDEPTSWLQRFRSGWDSLPEFSEIGPQFLVSIREFFTEIASWFDSLATGVSDKTASLEESATNATSHIISLIVVFVLQTVIFPQGFLWLFIEVLKAVAGRAISSIGTPNTDVSRQ
jgi:hypothetical protein